MGQSLGWLFSVFGGLGWDVASCWYWRWSWFAVILIGRGVMGCPFLRHVSFDALNVRLAVVSLNFGRACLSMLARASEG